MTADLSIRPDLEDRRSPLQDWTQTLAGLAPAITLTERPFLTHTTIWVDPASSAGQAFSSGLGIPLPTLASTFSQGSTEFGDIQVLWMGPEEFLIIGPEGTDTAVQSAIGSWLGDRWAGVVDVSAQRTTLTLSGPHARDVLAHGCAADLHPRVAPTGTCITALLAQTGIILQVLDAEAGTFQLLVRSSFAGYFTAWVADAAAEYTDPRWLLESL